MSTAERLTWFTAGAVMTSEMQLILNNPQLDSFRQNIKAIHKVDFMESGRNITSLRPNHKDPVCCVMAEVNCTRIFVTVTKVLQTHLGASFFSFLVCQSSKPSIQPRKSPATHGIVSILVTENVELWAVVTFGFLRNDCAAPKKRYLLFLLVWFLINLIRGLSYAIAMMLFCVYICMWNVKSIDVILAKKGK